MFKNTLRRGLALGTLSLAATAAQAQTLPIDAWEPLKSGAAIPSTTRQSGLDPDQVWLGYTDGKVYLSTSGRVASPAWTRLDSAEDGRGGIVNSAPGLAVTSIAPTYTHDEYSAFVSFAGTQQGGKFWRVVKGRGGLSWTDLTSNLPYGDVWNASVNPNNGTLYVATGGGVAYSTDFGATFTTVQPANDPLLPPSGSALSAVAVNPVSDIVVVGTTNGEVWLVFGAKAGTPSWTRIDSGHWGGMPRNLVSSIAIDSRDASGKTFYVSFGGRTDKAVWTTRTGGQFWVSIHNPNIPAYGNGFGAIVSSVSTVPGTGSIRTLYATTEYGAFRSDDDGATWFKTARWSGSNVVAEYKHSDNQVVGTQLYPNIRLRNVGSVPVQLKNIKFRYRYTREGNATETYMLDYSPYTVTRTIGALNAERALDLTIASSATVAAGQVSGEIQGRVAKSDWSNFDQSNDFSYLQTAASWTLNPYIAVYAGGNQVWGAFAR